MTSLLWLYLSLGEEDKFVEHVKDLKARLMDGEDDRALGVR